MANENPLAPDTPPNHAEMIVTQPTQPGGKPERNGVLIESAHDAHSSSPGTPFSLVPWLKTAVLYAGLFLAVFSIVAAGGWYLGYKPQAAAAAAAIIAFLVIMVLRMFLPSPFFKTKTETAPQPHPPTDSVREVIETVVFVVVLVLLLKSFVAEAFVIPTGSMAETLYGYQKVITCPKCQFLFPVNVSQEVDPSEGSPTKITGCTCPNCRYEINFAKEAENNRNWTDPGWGSGDRVLVGKYFYELVDLPERLDVVVFKYPGGDDWPASGPHKFHIPLNYIKRLIGKPGETIAIYKGKLYILDPQFSQHYDDYERAEKDPALMASLWQRKYQHTNEARGAFSKGEPGHFVMVRKPPETMLAMARVVYDNDHPASDIAEPRWAGKEWIADKTNGFVGAGSGPETAWLQYSHLLRGKDKKRLITDFTGYNTFETASHRHPEENWVGDLLLETDVTLDKAEGQFTLELRKSHDRFQARWDLATGDCNLYRLHDGKEELLGSAKTPVKTKGKTYRLRFADVDGKLTVWVDGQLPFGDNGVDYTTSLNNGGPTPENDLEPANIGIQNGAVSVHKIKLLRDTYYTNDPSRADYSINFDDPATWRGMDTFDENKVKTIYVQPHHYLCLGDNSPESSDSRQWGSVPERLLLGRAMLVYYPCWPFATVSRAGKIR